MIRYGARVLFLIRKYLVGQALLCLLVSMLLGCAASRESLQKNSQQDQQVCAGIECETCQGDAEALRQGMLDTITELVDADSELPDWQKSQIQAQAILPLREDNSVVVTGIDHQIEPVAKAMADAFERTVETLSLETRQVENCIDGMLCPDKSVNSRSDTGKISWVVLSSEGVKLVFEMEGKRACPRCESVIWNYRFGCSPEVPVLIMRDKQLK